MRVKFQADADLDQRVLRGLKRTVKDVDFQTATKSGLEGLLDPEVLRIAAEQGRILVSLGKSAGLDSSLSGLKPVISLELALASLVLIASEDVLAEYKGNSLTRRSTKLTQD